MDSTGSAAVAVWRLKLSPAKQISSDCDLSLSFCAPFWMDGRFVQFDVFFILNLARLNQINRLKPLPCYCHATAGSNSFEFDRAVERRHLKRAIDNRK